MSKAAEYFRMLAEIYSDPDRLVRDPNGTDNSEVISWCRQAAVAIDATTQRPWPPPEGVRKCLAWRKGTGWMIVWLGSLHGWRSGEKFLNRNLPDFWLPMPPEPEVGP